MTCCGMVRVFGTLGHWDLALCDQTSLWYSVLKWKRNLFKWIKWYNIVQMLVLEYIYIVFIAHRQCKGLETIPFCLTMLKISGNFGYKPLIFCHCEWWCRCVTWDSFRLKVKLFHCCIIFFLRGIYGETILQLVLRWCMHLTRNWLEILMKITCVGFRHHYPTLCRWPLFIELN